MLVNKINVNKWLYNLSRFGVSRKIVEEEKTKLSKKFGKEASHNDAIWSIFNKLIINHSNDAQKLAMIYYEMALFLNEEGKNPFDMIYQSNRMKLMTYRKSEFLKNVEIISAKKVSCAECNKLNEKIFRIEDAIKEMPLPNKKCTTHLHDGKFCFCRCVWAPHVIE